MKLFKILDGGKSCYGGSGEWHLPRDGEPGEWMPPIAGELVPCENGYHLCRESDLVHWLGPDIYEAEYEGEVVKCHDKVVVRRARLLRRVDTWNEQVARRFACDCVEHVLPLFENMRPGDKRPRSAVGTARQFAAGQATSEELAAAREAAQDAAGDVCDAARKVAWAAVSAAADAAIQTAWEAAKEARAAAQKALETAWEAAWDAEQQWQTALLLRYLYPE